MQFKVPQDVQRADQIVGPLTLRQLIICGLGGSITYGIFTMLARDYIWITWLPPVAIVAIITAIFAFIKPLDLAFERWLLFWIEFIILPKQRYFLQGSSDPLSSTYTPAKNKENLKIENKAKSKAELLKDKQKKLKNLSEILDQKH